MKFPRPWLVFMVLVGVAASCILCDVSISPDPLFADVDENIDVQCCYGDTTDLFTEVMATWSNGTEHDGRNNIRKYGIDCGFLVMRCSTCNILVTSDKNGLTLKCYLTTDNNTEVGQDNVTLQIRSDDGTNASSQAASTTTGGDRLVPAHDQPSGSGGSIGWKIGVAFAVVVVILLVLAASIAIIVYILHHRKKTSGENKTDLDDSQRVGDKYNLFSSTAKFLCCDAERDKVRSGSHKRVEADQDDPAEEDEMIRGKTVLLSSGVHLVHRPQF